jgi:hypothetical protein
MTKEQRLDLSRIDGVIITFVGMSVSRKEKNDPSNSTTVFRISHSGGVIMII